MKTQQWVVTGVIAAALAVGGPGIAAPVPSATGVPAQMVITTLPGSGGSRMENLEASGLTVTEGHAPAPVVRLERLTGNLADMQLFVYLDDSTRASSLGTQLPDLRTFLKSLPASTQVAVGYMRNGTFRLAQPFTTDHQKTARALRLPESIPGDNGSPYFALSDLVQHWPSKEATGRRAILMLTDGVDRYYGQPVEDDPYVDAAVNNVLKHGVTVYSIYLRGAGRYGLGGLQVNFAQSRLMQLSDETGGYAYFQDFSDPVSIAPFLTNLRDRLDHQYRVTVEASNAKGVQPVKVLTELPGLKICAPTHIYVQ